MRFLHTSDWHLGRIFHGLHMTDDQAIVLEELIALVKESNVDAVLIAGDIYDRAVPPTQAVTAGRGSAPFSPGGRQKCHYDRRQSR